MGYASDLTDEQWALLEPVFHDRGGPYGRTKGAQRVVAVDVTGLPVGALVVPASAHENRTGEVMLQHLTRQGGAERLELVLVDRGVTAAAARELGRRHGVEVRRVGWDEERRAPGVAVVSGWLEERRRIVAAAQRAVTLLETPPRSG